MTYCSPLAYPTKRLDSSSVEKLSKGFSSVSMGDYKNDSDANDSFSHNDENEGNESSINHVVDSHCILNRPILMTKLSHKTKKRIELTADVIQFSFSYKQISKAKSHEFSIDDVRHISDREVARHYREELGLSQECERRWISITYFDHVKQKLKCLHLVADTSHDLKKLLSTIEVFKNLKELLLKSYLVDVSDLDEVRRNIISDKSVFNDKSKKQLLLFDDILKYCKRLNINLSSKRLQVLFNNAKRLHDNGLDFEEFKVFVKSLRYRSDLATIWKHLTGSKGQLNLEGFSSFLKDVQDEHLSTDEVSKIFRKFCNTNELTWTCEEFNLFLNSKYLCYTKEAFRREGYYSHPLSEYYILSSHNTYLTGRQFAGESSVSGYVRALQRGCRCVEIDIWNSPDDNIEPIVTHGRTFTKGIKLADVLLTIKRYAFQSSNLPLILSLEIHCSSAAQLKAVEILQSTFGDTLVTNAITGGNVLPSPEELRNKVLVKVKKTSNLPSSIDDNGSFTTTSTTGNSFSESAESFVARSTSSSSSTKMRRKKDKLIMEELSNLGVYCQGLKFRNFSLPESKTFNHCFSLNEKALISMVKDPSKAEAVDKHNRRFLMRTYPSKYRLSSSNFIPTQFWAHGVQMVATNWQTFDVGQQINLAFFDGVSGNGYILKPSDLRRPTLKSTMRRVIQRHQKKLKFSIKIVSAQQLHRPHNIDALNPFVIFEIMGATSIDWSKDSSISNTKVVTGNGYNPIWNETFSGTIHYDCEIIFARFVVSTSASPLEPDSPKEIGTSIINIFDIKKGFRYLKLRDSCGELLLNSTLLLKIEFDTV